MVHCNPAPPHLAPGEVAHAICLTDWLTVAVVALAGAVIVTGAVRRRHDDESEGEA